MQLRTNLFTIKQDTSHENQHEFALQLNAEHLIYKAHFPGKPIMPGVCIVQIAKELAEEMVGRQLDVISVKNAKFLAVINPEKNPEVTYVVEVLMVTEDEVVFSALVKNEKTSFAKLSLVCKKTD